MSLPPRALALTCLAVVFSSYTAAAGAQSGGGEVSGVVRDSDGLPVSGADVIAQPDAYRASTDSAGRFILGGLRSGRYTVRARKLGFAHSEPWSVEVSATTRHEIELVMGRRMTALDTVVVRADGSCSPRSLDGFTCRRRLGRGLFLDYVDIDDTGARQAAEIFRTIDGFRVELRPTSHGPEPVVVPTRGWRCLRRFVDGRPSSPAIRVPYFAWEVVAMEVYRVPSEVPREYRQQSGNCSVVVFWTDRAPTAP